MTAVPTVPKAALRRVLTYLRILEDLEVQEREPGGPLSVSSAELAQRAGVTPFQVRKDLAYFGRFGKRGLGYSVPLLRRELQHALGLQRGSRVVIVGMGRLGQAIANYPGLGEEPFECVGLFDVDPALLGREVRGLTIQPVSALPDFVAREAGSGAKIDLGILTVPAEQAQGAAELLVRSGVRGILNFTPVVIQLQGLLGDSGQTEESPGAVVENVDFLAGMKRLAFYLLGPPPEGADLEGK